MNRAFTFAGFSRVLGVVLLLAGSLKTYDAFAGAWTSQPETAVGRWGMGGAVALEIVLGLWLLLGHKPVITRKLVYLCFTAFLGVSLAKALARESSCGCFGPVPMNPWITAGMDALVLLALLLFRPAQSDRTPIQPLLAGRVVFGLLGVLALFAGAWWGTSRQANRLEEREGDAGPDAIVHIDPRAWLGARLPLLSAMDVGDQCASGDWTVVLHRHDCRSCREEVAAFLRELPRDKRRAARGSVALVDVDPTGSRSPSGGDELAELIGTLRKGRSWVGRTPLFIQLQDGVVFMVTHTAEEALRGLERRAGGLIE